MLEHVLGAATVHKSLLEVLHRRCPFSIGPEVPQH